MKNINCLILVFFLAGYLSLYGEVAGERNLPETWIDKTSRIKNSKENAKHQIENEKKKTSLRSTVFFEREENLSENTGKDGEDIASAPPPNEEGNPQKITPLGKYEWLFFVFLSLYAICRRQLRSRSKY